MDLVIKLVVGGIVGWLASIVMKTNAQMGLIANVIVGIAGTAIGHWLAPKLGIGGGDVMSWLIAIGGAVLLLVVLKALRIFK